MSNLNLPKQYYIDLIHKAFRIGTPQEIFYLAKELGRVASNIAVNNSSLRQSKNDLVTKNILRGVDNE